MKVLRASFSKSEWKSIEAWLEAQGWSQYKLVKQGVLTLVGKVTAPEKLRKVPTAQKIIEKMSVCGITCIRRVTNKTTSMTLEDLEITVTATNADDAERLFKFARKEAEDLEKE